MEVNKLRSNLKNKKELNVWLRIVSTALKIFMCITVILFTIYVDKKTSSTYSNNIINVN
jgi:hypothetical protein